MLYRIEFANRVDLLDLAFAEKTCSWSMGTVENPPRLICEINLENHNRHREGKRGKVKSDLKRSFDGRPLDVPGGESAWKDVKVYQSSISSRKTF